MRSRTGWARDKVIDPFRYIINLWVVSYLFVYVIWCFTTKVTTLWSIFGYIGAEFATIIHPSSPFHVNTASRGRSSQAPSLGQIKLFVWQHRKIYEKNSKKPRVNLSIKISDYIKKAPRPFPPPFPCHVKAVHSDAEVGAGDGLAVLELDMRASLNVGVQVDI